MLIEGLHAGFADESPRSALTLGFHVFGTWFVEVATLAAQHADSGSALIDQHHTGFILLLFAGLTLRKLHIQGTYRTRSAVKATLDRREIACCRRNLHHPGRRLHLGCTTRTG